MEAVYEHDGDALRLGIGPMGRPAGFDADSTTIVHLKRKPKE
jgi:hypothetical protein